MVINQDATAQRDLIRTSEISAFELSKQYLDWIKIIQPRLNAFIEINEDETLERARQYDALSRAKKAMLPLGGLPFALKDNIDVDGWTTSAGMAQVFHKKAAKNAFLVDRLQQAGAIMLGKVSMHEAAFGATNANPFFGDCQNPHREGFTPGGSSGGSAASVAAMMTSFSIGSDTLGSIRIPASYCGVFGFKPSFGLVSASGTVPVARRLDHFGPLARSARDLRLVLEVIAAYDSSYAQSITRGPVNEPGAIETLRIGYLHTLDEYEVDDSIASAYQGTIDALAASGLSLRPLELAEIDFSAVRRAGLLLCEADMLAYYDCDTESSIERFSPAMGAMLSWAMRKSAKDLMQASIALDRVKVKIQQIFADIDLLLMPTTAQRAFSFQDDVPVNQADFTCLANVAGYPALSIPMPQNEGQLPGGFQVMGRFGEDRQVLEFSEFIQGELGLVFKPAEVLQRELGM